jgi:chromosome segregation ATPase
VYTLQESQRELQDAQAKLSAQMEKHTNDIAKLTEKEETLRKHTFELQVSVERSTAEEKRLQGELEKTENHIDMYSKTQVDQGKLILEMEEIQDEVGAVCVCVRARGVASSLEATQELTPPPSPHFVSRAPFRLLPIANFNT